MKYLKKFNESIVDKQAISISDIDQINNLVSAANRYIPSFVKKQIVKSDNFGFNTSDVSKYIKKIKDAGIDSVKDVVKMFSENKNESFAFFGIVAALIAFFIIGLGSDIISQTTNQKWPHNTIMIVIGISIVIGILSTIDTTHNVITVNNKQYTISKTDTSVVVNGDTLKITYDKDGKISNVQTKERY